MRRLLTKKEVRDAIAGKAVPPRVPVVYTVWFNPLVFRGLSFFRAVLSRFRYVDDIAVCGWNNMRSYLYAADGRFGGILRCNVMGYLTGGALTVKKRYRGKGDGVDSQILVEDMTKIDDFIKKFPDPEKAALFFPGPSRRYKVSWLFSFLFENHWTVRGMENALTDYYLYPEETHRLFRAFTDYLKGLATRSRKVLKADAIFITDDLGTQTGPFFSPEIFREFFYPYYKELIDHAHSLGLQVWLHTCGDVSMFMDMFVEMGLDMIHPVQKYAMNENEIFERYRDRIAFLYGFDVQHIIPEGTPDEVEAEAKRTMDLFSQAKGRFVYTTGNALTGDCPIKSWERLTRITHTYNPYEARKKSPGDDTQQK